MVFSKVVFDGHLRTGASVKTLEDLSRTVGDPRGVKYQRWDGILWLAGSSPKKP